MKVDNAVNPPGAFVKELLDKENMSIKELASKTGIPMSLLRDLLAGQIVLTESVAKKLETVFGVSAKTFINREFLWRKHLLKKTNE